MRPMLQTVFLLQGGVRLVIVCGLHWPRSQEGRLHRVEIQKNSTYRIGCTKEKEVEDVHNVFNGSDDEPKSPSFILKMGKK